MDPRDSASRSKCSRTRRPCKKAVLISILLHEGPLPSSNSKVLAIGFWVGLYLSIWLQGIPPRKYSAPLCKPLNPKSNIRNPKPSHSNSSRVETVQDEGRPSPHPDAAKSKVGYYSCSPEEDNPKPQTRKHFWVLSRPYRTLNPHSRITCLLGSLCLELDPPRRSSTLKQSQQETQTSSPERRVT